MYRFKNRNGYFNEDLPLFKHSKNKVNGKAMIGMILSGVYNNIEFGNFKIINYIESYNEFVINYNNNEYKINYNALLNGALNKIFKTFVDKNNKYIDENNVVHIFITNKKGQCFEALYSGNTVDKVMNTNWYVGLDKNGKVLNVRGSKTVGGIQKSCMLHQIDFPNADFVDHINNNPLDNRIENLRESNWKDNSKNKKAINKFGLVGLKINGKGYYSQFIYNKFSISTKTKRDLEEAKIDNLIAQRYLGYRHNNELFYLLDELPKERIKEVEILLESNINNNNNKIFKMKKRHHNYIQCDGYYKLIKDHKGEACEMLMDYIPDEYMHIWKNIGYWKCMFSENGVKIQNIFHREIMGLRPNDKYSEYKLHVDHLNRNRSDNRIENLVIATVYSNQCNKQSKGYSVNKNGIYNVKLLSEYRWFNEVIGGLKQPSFKTEQEAINEVNRRRQIIDNARVKLKSTKELDELIQYCLDNRYVLENGLADLDLGYLYWKGIIK